MTGNNNADIIKIINNSSHLAGLKQVLKAVGEGRLRCVILASDADHLLSDKVESACRQGNVEVKVFHGKAELGRAVGIAVPCAVVGIYK